MFLDKTSSFNSGHLHRMSFISEIRNTGKTVEKQCFQFANHHIKVSDFYLI